MLQKFKIASCAFILVFVTVQVFTIPAFGIQEPEDTPPMLPPRAQGQIKDALEKRVKDMPIKPLNELSETYMANRQQLQACLKVVDGWHRTAIQDPWAVFEHQIPHLIEETQKWFETGDALNTPQIRREVRDPGILRNLLVYKLYEFQLMFSMINDILVNSPEGVACGIDPSRLWPNMEQQNEQRHIEMPGP